MARVFSFRLDDDTANLLEEEAAAAGGLRQWVGLHLKDGQAIHRAAPSDPIDRPRELKELEIWVEELEDRRQALQESFQRATRLETAYKELAQALVQAAQELRTLNNWTVAKIGAKDPCFGEAYDRLNSVRYKLHLFDWQKAAAVDREMQALGAGRR